MLSSNGDYELVKLCCAVSASLTAAFACVAIVARLAFDWSDNKNIMCLMFFLFVIQLDVLTPLLGLQEGVIIMHFIFLL